MFQNCKKGFKIIGAIGRWGYPNAMCFERKRLHHFCQRTNNIQVLYFVTMLPKKKIQNHVNFLDLLWSRIGRIENKKLIVLIIYWVSKKQLF